MAKLKILNEKNAEAGSIEMPVQFSESLRPDIIIRAVLSIQANNRQPYGSAKEAGQRSASKISRRRRDYRGSYGHGISRVPRKIMSRRGTRMNWVGATAPGTVGGRRAHPPKPFSDWTQKLNEKENRKAIRSALSATIDSELVGKRGHQLPKAFPFIIDNSFEQIKKTSELEAALVHLGFAAELERAGKTGIRAGRGKLRGRKHKSPTSILFVVSKDQTALLQAVSNLSGCDIIAINKVNAEILAPGAHPGRLTLYTKAAVERLAHEGLFLKSYKGPSGKKEKIITEKSSEKTEKKPAVKPAAKKTAVNMKETAKKKE